MNDLTSRNYAEMIAKLNTDPRWSRAWMWFLSNAREWPGSDVDQQESFRYCRLHSCAPKACFYNAQKIALSEDDVEYWEGFACSIIPTDHAWVVVNGKIIDPTWVRRKDSYPPIDYYGIRIPKSIISEHWSHWGTAESLALSYAFRRTNSEQPMPRSVTKTPVSN